MYIIHTINKIATIVTLLLYVTVIFGMFAQIALGPIQLILATVITIQYYNKLDYSLQSLLLSYWFVAAIALLFILILWLSDSYNGVALYTIVFVIPMIVACYFLYVTGILNAYMLEQGKE